MKGQVKWLKQNPLRSTSPILPPGSTPFFPLGFNGIEIMLRSVLLSDVENVAGSRIPATTYSRGMQRLEHAISGQLDNWNLNLIFSSIIRTS